MSSSRKTIGVLLNQVEGRYQQQFWQGAAHGGSIADVNLVFYLGGDPALDRESPQKSTAYIMKSLSSMDGLLIAGAPLHTGLTAEQYAILLRRLPAVPSLVVSEDNNVLPCFTSDNHSGIRTLVMHFLKEHKARRFLFLRGEESHRDGRERWQSFQECMEEFSSEIENWEALQGNFLQISGQEAIERRFSGSEEIPFDALICANDEMAFGAVTAIRAMGKSVPGDLAVAGYDDVPEAAFFSPTLTTVHQATTAMTREGIAVLANSLRMGTEISSRRYPVELTVRQSCGCSISRTDTILSLDTRIMKLIETISPNGSRRQQLEALLDMTRKKAADPESRDAILNAFRGELAFIEHHEKPQLMWKLALLLRQETLSTPGLSADHISKLSTFYLSLLSLIHEASLAPYQQSFTEVHDKLYRLKAVMEGLNGCEKLSDLISILPPHIDSLKLKSFFLVLYPEPVEESGPFAPQPADADLILEIRDSRLLHEKSQRFSCSQILPSEVLSRLDRYCFFVSPLYSGSTHFGYMITELKHGEGLVSDDLYIQTLQSLIGASLHSIHTHAEKSRVQEELRQTLIRVEDLAIKDELTGLYNRRGFLTLANNLFEAARRKDESFTLLFADMDGLKQINDKHGHQYGDRAIRAMGSILTSALRGMDIIARMGGDEFTAFIPSSSKDLSECIKVRIHDSLSRFNRATELPFDLSVSLGVLHCDHDALQHSLEELLNTADSLLYNQKRNSRLAT